MNLLAEGATALDPSLDIVDAHHHLGDKYDPPYFLDDLLEDTHAGHRVTQTVFVECGWRTATATPDRPPPLSEIDAVAEMAMESRARGGTQISGIVGHVDFRLGLDATNASLDAACAAAQGLLVGIRHATAWDPSPAIPAHRTRPGDGLLGDDTFRLGLGALAHRNLVFDAWLFHPQLPELAALAADLPNLKIVLDHMGGPLAIGPYTPEAVDPHWRSSMTELARNQNVSVKLGGIGMPHLALPARSGTPVEAEQLAELWGNRIRFCINLFGPSRCMFESDFPVDRATCSYSTIWSAFKIITHDLSDADKAALFHQTARDVYRLPPPAASASRV